MLWFPELMNRFRWYETSYLGPKNMTNMCEIVSMFKTEPEKIDQKCNDDIDQSVYLNIIIIGIACIPTSLIVPLFVNKLGLRFFLCKYIHFIFKLTILVYILLKRFSCNINTYMIYI